MNRGHWWLETGVVQVPVCLVTCEAAWTQLLEKHNREDAPLVEGGIGITRYYDDWDKPQIFICVDLKQVRSRRAAMSVLIHEAVHAWQFICEYLGESAPGGEIEAYAVQTLAMKMAYHLGIFTPPKA